MGGAEPGKPRTIAPSSNGVTSTGGTPSSLLFGSGNTAIATVDANGQVTGVGPGSTTITITPGSSAARAVRAASTAAVATASATAPLSIPVTVHAETTPNIVIAPNPATVAVAGGATIVRGTFTVSVGGGLTIYTRATVVKVTAPTQSCASSGTYSFVRRVEFDDAGSQDLFITMPDPLPLTFTITGSSFTVTGPAPFIGGTGTIDSGCNVSMTATGTLLGIPNVNAILSGALPATGTARLVYQLGTNGSLPRGFPVYYRLTR